MPEKAQTLLTQLEEILGITAGEVVELEGSLISDDAATARWSTLVDTYRSISDLARRELESAYNHLFEQVAKVGAPVGLVIEAFAEEERAPGRGAKRLFEAVKVQFNHIVAEQSSKSEGETYLQVDVLRQLVANIIRPPWWSSGHVPFAFRDLDLNLGTIVRLVTPLRGAIGWAVASGHEANEEKQAEIDKQLFRLRMRHDWYERAFPQEVRRRILYADPSTPSIAAQIFDVSDIGFRPIGTLKLANQLESPAREGALATLSSALALHVLAFRGVLDATQKAASAHGKLQSIMHFVPEQLLEQVLSKDKTERLKQWLAQANIFLTFHTPRKEIEMRLSELDGRLTNLESIVSGDERSKDEHQNRLRTLLRNILELLLKETAHPWERGFPGEALAVVGNWCELLWENAVDDAFGRNGDASHYEEWEWLELRRSIVELALGLREGARFSAYGWRY